MLKSQYLKTLLPAGLNLHDHLVELLAQFRPHFRLQLDVLLLLLDQLILQILDDGQKAVVTLIDGRLVRFAVRHLVLVFLENRRGRSVGQRTQGRTNSGLLPGDGSASGQQRLFRLFAGHHHRELALTPLFLGRRFWSGCGLDLRLLGDLDADLWSDGRKFADLKRFVEEEGRLTYVDNLGEKKIFVQRKRQKKDLLGKAVLLYFTF